MEVGKLVQYTLAGIFGVVVLGIIAKDGQQLGQFMQGTSSAFGSFATSLGSLG